MTSVKRLHHRKVINQLESIIDQLKEVIDQLKTIIDHFSGVIVVSGPLTRMIVEAL